MKSSKLCRALRNNNPFNIKKSDQPWLGKRNFLFNDHEMVFEVFGTLEYGVRAGLKLLYNYIYLYGLDSVYKVINRFAPRCENATDAYVKFVEDFIRSHHSVYMAKEDHSFYTRENFFLMCEAIIAYETGVNWSTRKNFHLTADQLAETFDKYFPKYNFKPIKL